MTELIFFMVDLLLYFKNLIMNGLNHVNSMTNYLYRNRGLFKRECGVMSKYLELWGASVSPFTKMWG